MNPRLRTRFLLLALLALVLVARGDEGTIAAAEPTWDELRAAYDYDASQPLDVEATAALAADGQLRHIVFSSANGERVPALAGLPNAGQHGAGPYPAVVLGHGLGGSKDDQGFRTAAQFLLMSGYAAIIIDYPNHGERRSPELQAMGSITDAAQLTPELAAAMLTQLESGAKQTVFDQRRATDFLCSLPQVDKERIGYAGASLGAILGTVFVAVEPRIKAAVLIVGGADWTQILATSQIPGLPAARDAGVIDPEVLGPALQLSDPKWFAPHVACPTLSLLGAQDNIVPYEPCGKLLCELLGGDKTIKVFPDWGHGPTQGADAFSLISMLQQFLKEHLGATR